MRDVNQNVITMRILYIAPHSFPIHSSESIVNSKLAYTLCNAGYEVDVYSAQDDSHSYPSSREVAYSLQADNLKVNIVNVEYLSRDNNIFKNLWLAAEHFMGFIKTGYFYIGSNWGYKAIKRIEKNIRDNGSYDLMITRGFRTEIVGIYLNRKFDIKWIANWNDPYPEQKFPQPYGEGYDAKLPKNQRKLLNDIQKLVSVHTFPCERLRDYMLSYLNNIDIMQTQVIPHMAHSSLLPKDSVGKKRERLRLVHAGNVSYPRDPSNFLKALANVVNEDKYADKIECIFIGKQAPDFNQKIYDLKLEGNIIILPSMDYTGVLHEMYKSDASLIVEAVCEEGIYLPTKVVDSIQCRLPLFCVSPASGTLNDLIKNKEIGYFSDNTSIEDIEINLKKIIEDRENNRLPLIDTHRLAEYFETDILNSYRNIFERING